MGVGLVLAGCSSSPKAPPPPKPVTTTSTTATTLPPTTTTATQAVQPCTTTGVTVTSSSSQGAAGTLVQRFIVTNTTAGSCSMNGAPFISPYGPLPQGGSTVEADLPITVGPIPAGFGDLGGSGGRIVVPAGETAVFFLKWSDVTSASGPCYKGGGFDFRTPQDTNSKLVPFSFPSEICGGTLEVSQILAASVTS
jgi:hypothetical protein